MFNLYNIYNKCHLTKGDISVFMFAFNVKTLSFNRFIAKFLSSFVINTSNKIPLFFRLFLFV